MPALALAFLYLFSLLCAYYILRPVRDEMGIQGGVEQLQWTFTGAFVVMLLAVPLFGWAVVRFPRRRLLPMPYYFFIADLAVFYPLFQTGFALKYLSANPAVACVHPQGQAPGRPFRRGHRLPDAAMQKRMRNPVAGFQVLGPSRLDPWLHP